VSCDECRGTSEAMSGRLLIMWLGSRLLLLSLRSSRCSLLVQSHLVLIPLRSSPSLALFFVKRGFPYVAVMEGGFGRASGYLRKIGMKDLLEDYDPDVCMWTKMEEGKEEMREGGDKGRR